MGKQKKKNTHYTPDQWRKAAEITEQCESEDLTPTMLKKVAEVFRTNVVKAGQIMRRVKKEGITREPSTRNLTTGCFTNMVVPEPAIGEICTAAEAKEILSLILTDCREIANVSAITTLSSASPCTRSSGRSRLAASGRRDERSYAPGSSSGCPR